MAVISIIIPLFNKEQFIKKTLLSVLNQTFSDFEILLINDGSTDGSIDISISGGTSPYTYNWTPGGSINNLTGIPAGNYTLIVSDLNGCQLPAQTWTVTEPLLPVSISLSSLVNISCYGLNNGSVQLSASGGTPGYQVVYQTTSPVGPVFNPAGVEINLSGGNYPITNLYPGVYSLSVTDANGCQSSSPFTIIEPPAFAASVSANTIL